jgi:hypothetical protein
VVVFPLLFEFVLLDDFFVFADSSLEVHVLQVAACLIDIVDLMDSLQHHVEFFLDIFDEGGFVDVDVLDVQFAELYVREVFDLFLGGCDTGKRYF